MAPFDIVLITNTVSNGWSNHVSGALIKPEARRRI